MWKKWTEPPKREYKAILRNLQHQKKAKFYADEDVEDGAVAVLRECGLNITSARELGHRGKPDSFHAALAFEQKRFLLTRNGRDYLNDRKLPFTRIHGIVVITANPGNEDSYTSALAQLSSVLPYGELYRGMKVELSANEMKCRYITDAGKMVTTRLSFRNGILYEWAD
jgi:Domain of unknown function (DUF5615)